MTAEWKPIVEAVAKHIATVLDDDYDDPHAQIFADLMESDPDMMIAEISVFSSILAGFVVALEQRTGVSRDELLAQMVDQSFAAIDRE